GSVTLQDPVDPALLQLFDAALRKCGLQVIGDPKSVLVEKIKTAVIGRIHFTDEPMLEKFSSFLKKKLRYHYTYLSNLFSVSEGQTLEHYIIHCKIEKARNLLLYEGLSVATIAARMNYCSAAHLSRQIKKVTGCTASSIRKLNSLVKPVRL
ncbi:MAG: AraC family transcriptional regulator, partial [Chitinophagaceae bacterium]